jgi:hypothetical protein
MPPKGWKKHCDMSQSVSVAWSSQFVPFGDEVNFLSPEQQHLATGNMKILPPVNPEKRHREEA